MTMVSHGKNGFSDYKPTYIINTIADLNVNVNEFFYHLTSNLFTSNDNEFVYHFCCFDSEKVYHLPSKFRETLVMQHFPHKISHCFC